METSESVGTWLFFLPIKFTFQQGDQFIGGSKFPFAQVRRNDGLSPDGKLAAFTSGEGGGSDVWIRAFPVARGKWQVSSNQLSSAPRWSPDGQYVYFWRSSSAVADTLFRVRIERTPAITVRAPEAMLAMDVDGVEHWNMHPDGRRIIVTVRDNSGGPGDSGQNPSARPRFLVVQNWLTEIRLRTGRRDQP